MNHTAIKGNVEDLYLWADVLSVLVYNNCNLNTRKNVLHWYQNLPKLFWICWSTMFWIFIFLCNQKNCEKKRKGFAAKTSEKYMSVKIGCFKRLVSCRKLNAGLDESTSIMTSIPTLGAIGLKDGPVWKPFVYPNGKLSSIEPFYEPLRLKRKTFCSTLKQSTPKKKRLSRSYTVIEKKLTTEKYYKLKLKKNDISLLTDILKRYLQTFKTSDDGIQLSLFHFTQSFNWKADRKKSAILWYGRSRPHNENGKTCEGWPCICKGKMLFKTEWY